MEASKILTIKEAADILRISKSQLYRLVQENAVPNLKLGGRIVIPENRLRMWVEATVSGGEA